MDNNMNVYIISLYKKTGGPRSLHQFANRLVEAGISTYIFYGLRGKNFPVDAPLYDDCKAKITNEIIDNDNNWIIVTESDTGWLSKFHSIKKMIWWLSKTFYLNQNKWNEVRYFALIKNRPPITWWMYYLICAYKRYKNNDCIKMLESPDEFYSIYHLYNCQYARSYIIDNGASLEKIHYLCGPVEGIDNIPYNEIVKMKEDIICYNPTKAVSSYLEKAIKAIHEKNEHIIFKPLIGLTHDELIKTLMRSKVYMDFGTFTGPERIPREAAMCYCNIVTSDMGAARNSVDIPINPKFKFTLNNGSISEMSDLVIDMVKNFSSYTEQYDKYRSVVIQQKLRFYDDINYVIERFIKNNEQ